MCDWGVRVMQELPRWVRLQRPEGAWEARAALSLTSGATRLGVAGASTYRGDASRRL